MEVCCFLIWDNWVLVLYIFLEFQACHTFRGLVLLMLGKSLAKTLHNRLGFENYWSWVCLFMLSKWQANLSSFLILFLLKETFKICVSLPSEGQVHKPETKFNQREHRHWEFISRHFPQAHQMFHVPNHPWCWNLDLTDIQILLLQVLKYSQV